MKGKALPMDELHRIARGCRNSPTKGAIVSPGAELMRAQMLEQAGLIELQAGPGNNRVARMTSAGHAVLLAGAE
jgi:hypothetical protein